MSLNIVAHLLDALDSIRSNNPAVQGVNFDLLVRHVESRIQDEDRRTIRYFGASVDAIVASVLAPLTETGEVAWDPRSRVVAISDLAVLLLRSNVMPGASSAAQLDESQVAWH